MNKYFEEIDLENKTIILDIDGVLLADGEDIVDKNTLAVIEKFKKTNDIFLLSNNFSKKRIKQIAKQCDLKFIDTKYKKPNPKTLSGINVNKDLIVIGDRYWSDIRLAKKVKANFIKCKRKVSSKDKCYIKLSYLLDDLIWLFFKNK